MEKPLNKHAEELIDWFEERKLSEREALAVMGIAITGLLTDRRGAASFGRQLLDAMERKMTEEKRRN